jgi:hypothetical protein
MLRWMYDNIINKPAFVLTPLFLFFIGVVYILYSVFIK